MGLTDYYNSERLATHAEQALRMAGGFQPPQFSGSDQSNPGAILTGSIAAMSGSGGLEGRCTLDEPVTETIMRDVRAVGTKLKYVMLPNARHDKARGLKEWDLWGPLVLCLTLGMLLSYQATDTQKGIVFGLVFVVVWVGSAFVTLNAVLLKGQISVFQSVCVLGYCICPLVVAAILSMIVK